MAAPQNRPARFYSERFYLVQEAKGISGYTRWEDTEWRLVDGATARRRKDWYYCIVEYRPKERHQFRLENGRMPEYQPIGDAGTAMAAIRERKIASALLLHS